ncbi:MAG: hypothetical protein IKJ30_07165 [Bacilli bacterium]|nr:hypothetical protein [Bacilli bacterium]
MMNQYMLVNNQKLFAFSKKHGFTAKYSEGKWGPSNISYMALLAERDPNFVEISEDEAIILTKGNTPDEYFEKLAEKLKKPSSKRR